MTAPPRAFVSIGHWTDTVRQTGCTVILLDRPCSAVVDVRGGAPGARETDLLAADRLVGQVDAFLLTGGSAFGLTAAQGVMRFLHERGRGVPTSATTVPIVPAAVIYDLTAGDIAWPTEDDAYAACESAVELDLATFGRVGAGTGATFRKLWPARPARPGGIGRSSVRAGDVTVTAICVVNAMGDVPDTDEDDLRPSLLINPVEGDDRTATTLVALIVDGDCDERALRRAAVSAHDGMARAIVPCHTIWDGDLVFAVQTGVQRPTAPAEIMRISVATELAVEGGVRAAVTSS